MHLAGRRHRPTRGNESWHIVINMSMPALSRCIWHCAVLAGAIISVHVRRLCVAKMLRGYTVVACMPAFTMIRAWPPLQALTTAEACQPEVTRLPLSLEAARQCQTFQYNPVAFGMGSYITQVLGFVPQPWYERLLKSAHLQASPC